jgi:Enoyl-(Acyl carrier protein) reductase
VRPWGEGRAGVRDYRDDLRIRQAQRIYIRPGQQAKPQLTIHHPGQYHRRGPQWRGPAGVRVNAVNPGPTRTEGTAGLPIDEFAELAPAGRPASPDEIAAAITYLASDDASFVHGAILAVDGGRTAA